MKEKKQKLGRPKRAKPTDESAVSIQIRVSPEVHMYLLSQYQQFGDSFDKVIRRAIGMK